MKNVMVLGEMPGVGKTYTCKYLEKLGHMVLLVCPTNELCRSNELAITTNSFFFQLAFPKIPK